MQNNNRGRGKTNRGGKGGGGHLGRMDADEMDHISPRQRNHAKNMVDKYSNQAKDALSSGDRVLSEYYYQHADHYQRILDAAQAQYEERQAQRDQNQADEDDPEDQSAQETTQKSAEESSGKNQRQSRSRRKSNGHNGADTNAEQEDTKPVKSDNGSQLADVLPAPIEQTAVEEAKPKRRGRPRKSETQSASAN
jgi:hypothetical protein